jgi:hypothetical protein
MSDFARAMTAFSSPSAAAERDLVRRLLTDILDGDGRVRFKSVTMFHDHLERRYALELIQNATFGVRPGGRHLFYMNGNILLRLKTSGTDRRARPHLTISLATGLNWPDEVGKFSRTGDLIPKLGGVPRAASDFRTLLRLGGDLEAIEALDDAWANACHFDFVRGFDSTGAVALRPKKKA